MPPSVISASDAEVEASSPAATDTTTTLTRARTISISGFDLQSLKSGPEIQAAFQVLNQEEVSSH